MRPELLALALKGIADTAYFARGKHYYDQNRVQWLDEDEEGVNARVRGTRDYTVQLWEEDDKIRYNCDCPIGQDGEFCKHCVAVALAWLGEIESQPARPGEAPPKRHGAIEDIRDYLASLEPNQLIDLIVNACRRDDRMREKLLLAARGRGDLHAAIKTWKEALKRATATRGFVDYDEMPYFVTGIRDVVNALDSWITDGRAAAVVDLAEYAVARVESVMEECDDSNGELGGLLTHIVQLHLDACRAASPDPEELAGRLFEHELNGDWDTFSSAAELYAEVLGESGLARYRQLAEAEWAKVPALRPGDDENQTWRGNRYRITQIMETLARQSNDVEALVAIKSRDLSSAWRFLQIAEIYREAGRRDQALEWAERGLVAFPQRTDWRLREFLVEEYLQRGRGDEAIALVWAQFEERSDLGSFIQLKTTVQRADGDWPAWRDRALKQVRQGIAR
ncbi:MAG TPA: SWIM zinc finger family protein, partial [Candidatus Competibacter sp.]|nr:SWIM zinc finger family protein [Candidatus Competibacter sp.]